MLSVHRVIAPVTAAIVLGVGFAASPVSAAVSFAFAADVPNVTLNVGETAPVSIYLVETVTEGDASLLAAGQGLYSAQVTAAREQSSGAGISSYVLNPAFDGAPIVETTPAAPPYSSVLSSQVLSFSASSGVAGTTSGGVTSVLLMTVVVEAAQVAGQTSFSLTDDPQFTETFTFTGTTPLDPLISSGLFIVTTTIPEPAAIAGFAALAWVGRRRR